VSAEPKAATRKALLVARSNLYRVQLRCEVATLRERVSRPSRWIGSALSLFGVARTALAIASFVRGRR
jgi:hypothetical protein